MNLYKSIRNRFFLKNYVACIYTFALACISVVNACKPNDHKQQEIVPKETGNEVIELNYPKYFPKPEIPLDNLPTKNRIALGKQLFFDPILSRDSTISCGSCHIPEQKFQDNKRFSTGIQGRVGKRNAPSIINIAYQDFFFFWDGGVSTLELQVLAPIENHLEMDMDPLQVVERLKKQPNYVAKFKEAYGTEPTPFALTRAIANFERSIIGGTSKFDRYDSIANPNVFNESEKRGMDLFFNETGDCFHCHGGFNFTDNSFHNTGLYEVYPDSGRALVTGIFLQVGSFKSPSLRNVALTAPYMHDGSLATLEEVLEHYNTGGKKHPFKSKLMRPLGLTEQDKKDLINFLKTLSDE
jgi:cytochrome c peroxidase